MTLKNKLRALRSEHGFDQQYMANYLGIARTTYQYKETGQKDFTVTEAKRIAELFDLSIDDIFFTERVNLKNTYIVCPMQKLENS